MLYREASNILAVYFYADSDHAPVRMWAWEAFQNIGGGRLLYELASSYYRRLRQA